MDISVIFPAYNEAANLQRFPAEVFPVLDALGRSYEVIVVDDGSVDQTRGVAQGLGDRVRVVVHPSNMGLGCALRTGFKHASGDLVVTMDTDLTFAPSLVPKLLERFDRGDCDVVSGSPKLAGFGRDIPAYRVAVSHAATLVYSALLGAKVTSVSPILRLYRRSDLLALELHAVGFDINAEILFGLVRHDKRIVEIPAPLTVRVHGKSSLDYRREMMRHLRLVRRMAAWRARAAMGLVT